MDEVTRWHEASHQAIAVALGARSGGVTTLPGRCLDGCGRFRPQPIPAGTLDGVDARSFYTWPPGLRADVEIRMLVALAGTLGEELLLRDEPVTLPPVVRAEAVVLAASLPEADPGDVEALSELTDSAAVRSDDGEVQHLAAAAWPGEPYLQRTFTEHMEAAAASLIRAEAPTIRKLVALLEYRPVLDGAAVAACIGEGQS